MPSLTVGPVVPRQRLGRRGLLTLGVVVFLVVAGVAALGLVKLLAPTPESTVRDFFAALSDGDADKALGYFQMDEGFDKSRYPLLSRAALGAAHRPSDVHVGEAKESYRLSGRPVSGERWNTVAVTYRAAGKRVEQTVGVVETDGRYRMGIATVKVVVTGAQGREITVNGVDMGSSDVDTAGFPGSFEVTVAGNALLAGETATATPQPGTFHTAEVDLDAPTLADGATEEIQKQVRNALDTCVTSTDPAPPGCPFSLTVPGTNARVDWSVTAYPVITAQVGSGDSGVAVSSDGTGIAHWVIDYVDWSGAAKHETGDVPFGVNGSAQLSGSGIQVSLNS